VPAGGYDISVIARRPLQCNQEAVLCRVPCAVTSYCDKDYWHPTETARRHAEDCTASQLQARRRTLGREASHGNLLSQLFWFCTDLLTIEYAVKFRLMAAGEGVMACL